MNFNTNYQSYIISRKIIMSKLLFLTLWPMSPYSLYKHVQMHKSNFCGWNLLSGFRFFQNSSRVTFILSPLRGPVHTQVTMQNVILWVYRRLLSRYAVTACVLLSKVQRTMLDVITDRWVGQKHSINLMFCVVFWVSTTPLT